MTPKSWDEIRLNEIRAIEDRYARRQRLYDPLDPYICRETQQSERARIRCIRMARLEPVGDKRVLEIGCGNATDLIERRDAPAPPIGRCLYGICPARYTIVDAIAPLRTHILC